MKKLGLLLIVLMPVIAVFGQTEKGNFVLSGAAGLNFNSSVKETAYSGMVTQHDLKSFPILPTMGYFIADNLAFELSGGIYIEKEELSGDNETVFIMPAFLHYLSSRGKLRPFIQAGLGYSWVRKTWSNGFEGADDQYRGLAGNFGGGVSYFIAKRISLDLGLKYTALRLKHRNVASRKYKQGEFGSNVGFSIYF